MSVIEEEGIVIWKDVLSSLMEELSFSGIEQHLSLLCPNQKF